MKGVGPTPLNLCRIISWVIRRDKATPNGVPRDKHSFES
ncbi:hypothetical protein ABIF29_000282 [Bradyrhizobium elkanii]|uniref:Transposase n=1 Tax=Bradyrhizobium elkanii TaxID=29448 RepID=A0ABV4EQR4_BRAEL|nr:hypothetical protein [Bradyrhizobium elkanii]MCS3890574.1 hypothetical protein [Bradyrhizobium elkanii]MCS4220474.1 hypothetical protein [Bradyrhizobium elkanii]MCW2216335.1 hypothetical protein [Bradyrhizobium elkanii]MCW2235412.1 hypothetical protein [Bradyrhizobium elkanii]